MNLFVDRRKPRAQQESGKLSSRVRASATASLPQRTALALRDTYCSLAYGLIAEASGSKPMCFSPSGAESVLQTRISRLDDDGKCANENGECIWEEVAVCVYFDDFVIFSSFFHHRSHCIACLHTSHSQRTLFCTEISLCVCFLCSRRRSHKRTEGKVGQTLSSAFNSQTAQLVAPADGVCAVGTESSGFDPRSERAIVLSFCCFSPLSARTIRVPHTGCMSSYSTRWYAFVYVFVLFVYVYVIFPTF